MTSGWNAARKTMTGLLLAGLCTAVLPAPAAAQDDEERVERLEAQVRALQRAVFPGPNGRFFAPEVDTSADAVQPDPVGAPADTVLTDVLVRLDALEAQLARLTARSEESANELAQLQAELDG